MGGSTGASGRRRTARASGRPYRSSPRASSSSAVAATVTAAATSSCPPGRGSRRAPTSRRRQTTTSRSRREMAREKSQQQQRRRPGGPAGQIRRRNCFFCKEKIAEIDYKNVNQLRRYISEKGKIRSRRITGACRRHQVQVATAVKRAREMALLPYVAEGAEERSGGRRDRGDRGDRGDRHRGRALEVQEDPRRPAQDRDRSDQADRTLRDPDRTLRGRPGRGADRGRPGRRRAAVRHGARGDGGGRARRAGGGRSRTGG